MQKFIDFISNKLLTQQKDNFFKRFIFVFIFISPLLITAVFSIFDRYNHMTDMALDRRVSIAAIASEAIHADLNSLVDMGISLATRDGFRSNVALGKWDEAIEVIKTIPEKFPYIERVALIDPEANLKAISPYYPIIGQNFSERDWYKGVIKKWEPYVSEVFKSATSQNSIVISIPITSESGEHVGILNFQILTDVILDWSKEIKIGEGGSAYIFDQQGHIVADPQFSTQGEIVDFGSMPVVRKTLSGAMGVDIGYDKTGKEENVSAYYPVDDYGWGIVVQQPVRSVFADRNRETIKLLVLYTLMIIFGIFLGNLLMKLIQNINTYRQKERILLDSIGDGVVAIDRFWNIVLWNKSAEKLTGWHRDEVLGKPLRNFLKFIREADRTENIAFIEEAIIYGRTGFLENNTVLITKENKEMPVGDSAAPIFESNSIISGAVIVFRDVSTEKESHNLKSDFAYASHQLNTPVTKALWNLEAALDEKDYEKIKEKISIAYQSAKSIQKLNAQLFEVSEIDQKIIIPKYENARLADLVGEVMKDFQKKCKDCNVSLAVDPVSPVLGLKTDSKILKRILTEITENALFYSKSGSTVAFKVNIQNKSIIFEVSDNGVGIGDEQKTLIFTKFFRGNNFDTTNVVGAGLGLFIAQSYIKLLNGKIWFNSEKGKGTTFFVSLPAE